MQMFEREAYLGNVQPHVNEGQVTAFLHVEEELAAWRVFEAEIELTGRLKSETERQ